MFFIRSLLLLIIIHLFNHCPNMHLHSALSRVVNHQAVQDFLDKQVLNHFIFLACLLIKLSLGIGRLAHHLIQGTEEDRQILMSDCRVNIKEEKVDQKMVEKSREVKSNHSVDPAVVQLNVSLDSYLPPGPRQPDTLVMASRRSAHCAVHKILMIFFPNVRVDFFIFSLGVKVKNSNLSLEL